ncbi:NAD(P)H-binding protein [Amycolatopsis sp., V23-08]|uniref:NAD(P)H-binding protein n=1 Tax=Amycolatopsis heterodermiae TaxID=3110235 RepID=A0ABU5R2N6_9PSEU|nr:NAD(P)H-binding protein [Amycolatopsis sp., V23-08]MEA5360423.1 NAD(P)H-binding protein [Amycolatopsis sp., V23-08]
MRIAVAGADELVGPHVAEAARGRGHTVVALESVDLTGDGLSAALDGVDAVVDVSNSTSLDEEPARRYFTTAAANLQRAGAERGVRHIVTLSVVGIDDTGFGYFRAKEAHERAAGAGPVPATIVRATHFHEFPGQLVGRTRDGGQATVFGLRVQTVAATAVAAALVEVAERPAQGRTPDIAGPEPAEVLDLARAFVDHFGLGLELRTDDHTVTGIAENGLLPGAGATILGPSYAEWLHSPEAAALASDG